MKMKTSKPKTSKTKTSEPKTLKTTDFQNEDDNDYIHTLRVLEVFQDTLKRL